jgi:hypothetical protein
LCTAEQLLYRIDNETLLTAQAMQPSLSSPTVNDDSSTSIISSPYFQPRIIDAYLSSALNADRFPKQSINAIRDLARSTEVEGDQKEDGLVSLRVAKSYEELKERMQQENVAALQDAIRALSSQLTISEAAIGKEESSKALGRLENRTLLGFCRITSGRWQEATVDLDIVRRETHHRVKTQKAASKEQETIYIDALSGLLLVSLLLGKHSEAVKFARWKREASRTKG